jgi:hypothetical protein
VVYVSISECSGTRWWKFLPAGGRHHLVGRFLSLAINQSSRNFESFLSYLPSGIVVVTQQRQHTHTRIFLFSVSITDIKKPITMLFHRTAVKSLLRSCHFRKVRYGGVGVHMYSLERMESSWVDIRYRRTPYFFSLSLSLSYL